MSERPECQVRSLDYGSYGYPCRLDRGHDGPHEVLDKDDCPHTWWLPGEKNMQQRAKRPAKDKP